MKMAIFFNILFYFIYFIYFISRERERERERGEKHGYVATHTCLQLGTGSETQACAPTRNQIRNLSVCGKITNSLNHTNQD